MLRLHSCFQHALGISLFLSGLPGDCMVGMLLLTRGTWQLLLWHVPLTLLWAWGVNLIAGQNTLEGPTSLFSPNKWGITALLLGTGTFPGFGSCMYSMAFLFTRYLFSPFSARRLARGATDLQTEQPLVERFIISEEIAQPLVDELYEENTEVRRAVVAKLSRCANPDAVQLLRQLLSDAKAEIRSDASIALARLDDEMSRALNLSFDKWSANPTDLDLTLTLADHYYHYATSNVLDKKSQRFYLELARDLLTQARAREEVKEARFWLRLAHIRQRLGELPEALRDALHALRLQPDHAEATLFAMDLAFCTRCWDILVSLARPETSAQPGDADGHTLSSPLHWWTTLSPELSEGVHHE